MEPITIHKLLPPINRKLKTDFGYEINVDGLQEVQEELSTLLDLDVASLVDAAKETMMWNTYLIDIISLMDIAIGKYKNILDIYEYLDAVAVKDPETFALAAPKYKIDSRNIPLAIKEVQAKSDELSRYLKGLRILRSDLDAIAGYMLSMHYRCNSLIWGANRRMSNSSL